MFSVLNSEIISENFDPDANAVVYPGDCLEFLQGCPSESFHLIITSPPYNIGKKYEQKQKLADYLEQQSQVIRECVRCLHTNGSICWQVGNFVNNGSIIPLDAVLFPIFSELGLQMRNRIVWHFEHGLHCSKRFSGRYETVVWFTKTGDYYFNLDPVRVPQKYPGKKHFKGPRAGEYSCNPLGKNPGDVWSIPNVKSNHIEKTAHPCQFPVELVERFVLALTREADLVFDPYLGSGSTVIAAIRHGRKGFGSEILPEYVRLSKSRIVSEMEGTLKTRPLGKPTYDPLLDGCGLAIPPWEKLSKEAAQLQLLEQPRSEGRKGAA